MKKCYTTGLPCSVGVKNMLADAGSSLAGDLLIRSHVPQCNILCVVTKTQSSQKYI